MYRIEITDTYGGEANYSWVKRFTVKTKTKLGAIRAASRETGYHFQLDWDSGDCARYNARGACVCAFVTWED